MSDSSFCPKVVKIFKIPGISQEYLSKMPGMSWTLSMKFVLDIHVVFIIHWIKQVLFSPTNWLYNTFHFTFLWDGEKQYGTLQDLTIQSGVNLPFTIHCPAADDSACRWFLTLAFLHWHLLWGYKFLINISNRWNKERCQNWIKWLILLCFFQKQIIGHSKSYYKMTLLNYVDFSLMFLF